MDYGNNKTAVVTAVKTELNTDPTGIGYRVNGLFRPIADLAELLCHPSTVANPHSQPQIPAPLTIGGLLSKLSTASQANLLASGYAKTIADAITTQDRPGLTLWLSLFLATGKITADEATQLQAELTTTIPDPSWESTVSGPCRLELLTGYGAISPSDVQEALAS